MTPLTLRTRKGKIIAKVEITKKKEEAPTNGSTVEIPSDSRGSRAENNKRRVSGKGGGNDLLLKIKNSRRG